MLYSNEGSHVETTTHYHTHTDDDGHTRTDTTHHSEEVTDFHFTLDLTEYIIPRGIITVNVQGGQPAKDLRELLQEYIDHKNKLKEIKMKKVRVENWHICFVLLFMPCLTKTHRFTISPSPLGLIRS